MEPLSVERPGAVAEDDGVLLVPTLADDDTASVIGVIDASTMQCLATLHCAAGHPLRISCRLGRLRGKHRTGPSPILVIHLLVVPHTSNAAALSFHEHHQLMHPAVLRAGWRSE